MQFIWANEDTGFRHLYQVTSQISQITNGVTESSQVR